DQMHRDDAIESFRIEPLAKGCAQTVFVPRCRAKADDAEHRAPALSATDRDARDRADHVFETTNIGFRPIGLAGKRGAIGWAIEHIEGLRGIETEIFRGSLMGDVAP